MSLQPTHPTLALQPGSAFAQLDAALARMGWERGADTSVAPPLVPGSPPIRHGREDAAGHCCGARCAFENPGPFRVLNFCMHRPVGRPARVGVRRSEQKV